MIQMKFYLKDYLVGVGVGLPGLDRLAMMLLLFFAVPNTLLKLLVSPPCSLLRDRIDQALLAIEGVCDLAGVCGG